VRGPKKMKYVPDTSVLVDGRITELIERNELVDPEVIIPEAVIVELEVMANKGLDTGFAGLEELRKLSRMASDGKIEMKYTGPRPTPEQIEVSHTGEIDRIVRDVAREEDAVLITGDYVQARVAGAYGLRTIYLRPEEHEEPEIMKYFDETTMSVHIREGVPPMAKKGRPGNFKLVEIGNRPITEPEIRKMAREIVEFARRDRDSFIEIEREGATVVQMGPVRIAIARPPFSDGYEITAVRPIAKVTLEEYSMSEKLKKRIEKRAEGILISGPPGAGKSTFAQALAEFYSSKGKIVKTMESPRDLQVSQEITQYSPLEGDMEKTAEVLLLVRPDYTVYDEMRKTKDFEIFADMRLAGVGMIGVVHSTRPIDALQRFIGRVELGVIPQIVDTVIFIEDGEIRKVYEVRMTVKVPTGMTDLDLARPVIEVRDFERGEVEYEIYTYGEQVVVIPVRRDEKVSRRERTHEIIGIKETKKQLFLLVGKEFSGERVALYCDGEYVLTARVNRSGEIRINKRSGVAKRIVNLLKKGGRLSITPQ